MSGEWRGQDPQTVRDVAAAFRQANRVVGDTLAALVAVRATPDAALGSRAEQLRASLEPAIRRTEASVRVADTLTAALLGQIGQQVQASRGGPVTRVAAPGQGRRRVRAVLIGNSFESGEGVAEGRGDGLDRWYLNPLDRRHRSPFAAVPQALSRLVAANPNVEVDLFVAASSGAVTRDVFCDQTQDGRAPGQRVTRPWQVNPSQLFQIPVEADVVVAGFGGNDALFGPAVTAAHTWGFNDVMARAGVVLNLRNTGGEPYTAEELRDLARTARVGDERAPLAVRWLQVIDEIRSRAPNATIVIPNYPIALDPRVMAANSWVVSQEEAERLRTELGDRLNAVMARVVEVAGPGVVLADVSRTLDGHEVYTAEPWMNGIEPYSSDRDRGLNADGRRIMEPFVHGPQRNTWPRNEPFHPNARGYGAMADPIASAIAGSLGLAQPVPSQPGSVTTPSNITIIESSSDIDGDGIRDSIDPTPGTPRFVHQGLVACPPGALPLFPRTDRAR